MDTHVLHWWSSEPVKLSRAAARALARADELAVSGISWYELAWLVRHRRIGVDVPLRPWLRGLEAEVRTIGLTPAIAETAASLPESFPRDPIDRIIYATAVEHGWGLISRDERMRRPYQPRAQVIW
jgi:PIN domain nuclease of toxin-antitoxin system